MIFRIVGHLVATHPFLQRLELRKTPPVHLSASGFVQLLPLDSVLDSFARLKKAAWFLHQKTVLFASKNNIAVPGDTGFSCKSVV